MFGPLRLRVRSYLVPSCIPPITWLSVTTQEEEVVVTCRRKTPMSMRLKRFRLSLLKRMMSSIMLVFTNLPLWNYGKRSTGLHGVHTHGSRSHPGGRSFSQYDDAQATDATRTRTSSHLQADTRVTMSDLSSDSRAHEARERQRLPRKPVPHVFGTLPQVEKDTVSSVETLRKVSVATNPVSEPASVHSWVFA